MERKMEREMEREAGKKVEKEPREVYDVLVIGGGLLGCFAALHLSRAGVRLGLLEKREDVCTGISRANTAVIYPGYDNRKHSLKTEFTIRANARFPELCKGLGVAYSPIGSLLVSAGPRGDAALRKKFAQGVENGVPGLSLLSPEKALALEPGLTREATLALYAPTAGTVHPWELCIAASSAAGEQGCRMHLNTCVKEIRRRGDLFLLRTLSRGRERSFAAKAILNCAGLAADLLQAQVAVPKIRIRPERAEYLILEPEKGGLPRHILFQETEEKGKGVTLVPTANGKLLVGTTAFPTTDREDRSTTAEGFRTLCRGMRLLFPALSPDQVIRSFAGIRPNPCSPGDPGRNIRDFPALFTETPPGFFSLTAVKTPGLTCADELGRHTAARILARLGTSLPDGGENVPAGRPQRQKNTGGRILCRCEQVTEEAVLDAIARGAVTIDGVKRRTGAGMGRCQGSHCSTKIAALLSRELGIPPTEVTKDGGGSYFLEPPLSREACAKEQEESL